MNSPDIAPPMWLDEDSELLDAELSPPTEDTLVTPPERMFAPDDEMTPWLLLFAGLSATMVVTLSVVSLALAVLALSVSQDAEAAPQIQVQSRVYVE